MNALKSSLRLLSDFLYWLFVPTGVSISFRNRENIDSEMQLVFAAVRRPLVKMRCPYCNVPYWTWSKRGGYCGAFRCFRRFRHEGR